MFPALVGMNRCLGNLLVGLCDVPRTRGDEPGGAVAGAGNSDVPRTRGDEPA